MRRSSDFLEAGDSNKLTHLRENAEWDPPPSCTAALSTTAPLAQYSVIMVEEGWQVVGGETTVVGDALLPRETRKKPV